MLSRLTPIVMCYLASSCLDQKEGAQAADVAAESDAVRGLARCWPDEASEALGLSCDAGRELCLNNWSGDEDLPPARSCQPLPTDCASTPTCACVQAHIHCGLTTWCSEGDGGPLRLTCSFD